jgi:NTP pyrophosphatase (non-canonical NTP hydrolase)
MMNQDSATGGEDTQATAWTIGQTQGIVDEWIRSIGVRYFDPMTNLAQLMEEVGEVARVLSRTHGEQSKKAGETLAALDDELADVMFVVICLANQSGIDLQAAMERNLAKKTKRDLTRHKNNEKLAPPPA